MLDRKNPVAGEEEGGTVGLQTGSRSVVPPLAASEVLNGVATDYFRLGGADLVGRWEDHASWLDARLAASLDSYSKSTAGRIVATCAAYDRGGRRLEGINFASQDYLSLASHPAVVDAAKRAAQECGVHSAGSAALMGNTQLSTRLEFELAEFLGYRDCTVFPTGWGAGYGVIKTLIRQGDHVVIDILAHACLQEGARNATGNVHTFPHLSNEGVLRRLRRIRTKHPDAGILVVTESVFSMDSDVPDIAALQAICRDFNATLLVDVAHDLGAVGPTGLGYLELQGMAGKVDLLMGSLSKSFASNGGFVACANPALKLALRYHCGPLTFSNALSPIQAATVLAALGIVRSPEGAERRAKLMENIVYARNVLEAEGFKLLGRPSPIIPVAVGDGKTSRLATRNLLAAGGIVNLVEYPAVARNQSRWRLQLMADHSFDHIDAFVRLAAAAWRQAQHEAAFPS